MMSPLEAKGLLAMMLVLIPAGLRCLDQASAAIDIPKKDDKEPPPSGEPITLPGCPDSCGNIRIPYPFGTKPGCFLPGFEVVCNDTFSPPRPFIANPTLTKKSSPILWIQDTKGSVPDQTKQTSLSLVELIDMSPENGQARVYAAVSFVCNTSTSGGYWERQQLIDTSPSSPFVMSNASNVLVGIGRGIYANLDGAWPGLAYGSYVASCRSQVAPQGQPPTNGSCAGVGCCQAERMESYLRCSRVTAQPMQLQKDAGTCVYAMLVERSWYNFSVADLDDVDPLFLKNNPRGVPVVLNFAITTASSCPAPGQPVPQDYACKSGNSSCFNATNVVDDPNPGYLCKCRDGYDGNPYIPDGCQGNKHF